MKSAQDILDYGESPPPPPALRDPPDELDLGVLTFVLCLSCVLGYFATR